MIIMLTNRVHHRILTFGMVKNLSKENEKLEKQFKSRWCCVLLPNNRFSLIWNMIMILLMFYVLIFVTFDVAFTKQNINFQEGYLAALKENTKMQLDVAVDILFTIDILVNFISAYEDNFTCKLETSLCAIGKNYIMSWFLLDVLCVIPFDLIEYVVLADSRHVKLVRLSRLARIYKLTRVIRLLKIVKTVRFDDHFMRLGMSSA